MEAETESHHELVRWLEGVNAFITAVNRPASLRELLDLATATACDLLGYDFCGVLLVRPEERRLIMEGAHGLSHEYVEQLNAAVPLSLGGQGEFDSPSTRAFLSARPVVVNDVLSDPLMKPWHTLARQQGYQSIVSVPLLLRGRPFGVLNCYSARRHGISVSSVKLLGILANLVATAIESIHLRDEQRANIDRLALANNSLRRQRKLLEEAEETHKRLNDIALGAGGLDDICEALTQILDRDILIDDPYGRRFAPSTGDPASFAGRPEPGFATPLADIEELTTGDGNRCFTVLPLRVTGDLIARIWIAESTINITDLQRRALESASVIIALEILRRQAAQEAEWRVRGEIVEVLLHGGASDMRTLISRAAMLGHDLEQPHHFILIGFAEPEGQGNPMEGLHAASAVRQTVASVTENLAPKPLTAVDDGFIVTLLPASILSGTEPPAEIFAIERALSTRHGLTPLAIVGPVCLSVIDYSRALRVTRGAMALQRRRNAYGGVVSLPDLGLVNLLMQVDDVSGLDQFSLRILDPIRQHDDSKSAALESTIRAYLIHACSVPETAKELFVHPNTVKLRLRKVEALLGINLNDPEDVLTLQSALLIDEVAQARPTDQ